MVIVCVCVCVFTTVCCSHPCMPWPAAGTVYTVLRILWHLHYNYTTCDEVHSTYRVNIAVCCGVTVHFLHFVWDTSITFTHPHYTIQMWAGTDFTARATVVRTYIRHVWLWRTIGMLCWACTLNTHTPTLCYVDVLCWGFCLLPLTPHHEVLVQ